MFVQPKMGHVQAKIGLTRQFDRHQTGNYLKPWVGVIHLNRKRFVDSFTGLISGQRNSNINLFILPDFPVFYLSNSKETMEMFPICYIY